MLGWQSEESEDSDERPGEHPCLTARQRSHRFTPPLEFRPIVAAAVKEVEKAGGERFCAGGAFDCVTERHLLELEEKVGSRFYGYRAACDFGVVAFIDEGAVSVATEELLPALVRFPFVSALPVDVLVVVKALWKKAQKLPPTPNRALGCASWINRYRHLLLVQIPQQVLPGSDQDFRVSAISLVRFQTEVSSSSA